jgi:hypothetical protein
MYNLSRKYLKGRCHFRFISVYENITLKYTLQKQSLQIFGPAGLKWLRVCSNGGFSWIGTIEGWKLLDQQSDYYLLKKSSVSWSWLREVLETPITKVESQPACQQGHLLNTELHYDESCERRYTYMHYQFYTLSKHVYGGKWEGCDAKEYRIIQQVSSVKVKIKLALCLAN